MAFALAARNTVTRVRQLFFTTTCLISITTVIFVGGATTPMLSFLKVIFNFPLISFSKYNFKDSRGRS